ncbi:hypothetical protein [Frankia sp. Cj3]|uniref:hypothetical protein n=1 Tax=Frankia sp. Cj3 TaxID=2880976 RepID=UPI001EF58D6F|nr:hypothetical protein [Frankia sp. Cj3]
MPELEEAAEPGRCDVCKCAIKRGDLAAQLNGKEICEDCHWDEVDGKELTEAVYGKGSKGWGKA